MTPWPPSLCCSVLWPSSRDDLFIWDSDDVLMLVDVIACIMCKYSLGFYLNPRSIYTCCSFIRSLPWHCQTCTVLVIREDCAKQVNNFSGNIYQGYASREVAEEKWRRHGRKKWRNFIVIITALLLSMAGRLCALLSPKLARAPSSEL